MQCRKCSRVIEKYPCPHCGFSEGPYGAAGDYVKEGGTGGGQPGN